MGRIASSVGLLSGFPIQDTVDQLMALSTIPRNRLQAKTDQLTQRSDLLSQLTSKLIGVQFSIRGFGESGLYDARRTTSSAEEFLTASAASGTAAGTHSIVPLQLASTNQHLSSRVAAREAGLDAGSFVIRPGRTAGDPIVLGDLNAGLGVTRGSIEIVNRAGESATIDLAGAHTTADVADAISRSGLDVTASFSGDAFVLSDASGGAGNLQVLEVEGGTTAAGLGLTGIDVAADAATGADVLSLHSQTALSRLNDGLGVRTLAASPELQFVFSDGSGPLEVSVHVARGETLTLGDVVRQLNEADPTRLAASISTDGDHLVLEDLTAGGGSFVVRELGESGTLVDLGFIAVGEDEVTASGSQLVSRRLQAGLQDVLVASLGGAAGLGELGSIQIQDRNGATTTVDLSSVQTLGEIAATINAAGADVTASVAPDRDALVLTDVSGGVGDLIVSSVADGFDTAEKLGVAATESDGDPLAGADLQRRRIHAGTSLDRLALDGQVGGGAIQIVDSLGASGLVDLDKLSVESVGDLIDAINATGIAVTASINDAGDGIQLLDDGDGSGTLTVRDTRGQAAQELRLTGAATSQAGAGGNEQVVQGGLAQTITIEEGDTIDDVAAAINDALPGYSATVAQDASGARLLISAGLSGAAANFRVDDAGSPLAFHQSVAGRDALLIYGAESASDPGGLLLASSTNRFQDAVEGLDLDVKQASQQGVTVDIAADVDSAVSKVQALVEAVNDAFAFLDENQQINTEDRSQTGLLYGVIQASSARQALERIFRPQIRTATSASVATISDLGLKRNSDGTIEFDEAAFREAFEEDADAVQAFFGDEETGFAHVVDTALETYVGSSGENAPDGVILYGIQSLQRTIDSNTRRIEQMDVSLERKRNRMLVQFQRMETAIAQMQNNLSSLQGLAPIAPTTSSNNSGG